MGYKNGFFICEVTEEDIPQSGVPTFGSPILKKEKETDFYTEYGFYWFDAVNLIDTTIAGQFHDITMWQLKSNPNVYVVFMLYKNAFEFFRKKFHELKGISLKSIDLDFNTDKHANTFAYLTEKYDENIENEEVEEEDLNYIHNPLQVSNKDILSFKDNIHSMVYHMKVKEKTQTIECFTDGRFKFGIEKDDEVVFELVKYALTFAEKEVSL